MGRLAYPMLRERGDSGFRRVTWDEALARVARRMRTAGADRIAFYLTARGLANETYTSRKKVARFLGTINIDNAARLCHSPSTSAMKRALGVAASTCSYRDWWGTDLLVFFGSNPANDQPVAVKYIHEAKRLGTSFAFTVIRHVEAAELDGFAQLEHILGLARAKAQLILASRS